jgi:photosystem II stability/assembly factor-like uncharacterized protein
MAWCLLASSLLLAGCGSLPVRAQQAGQPTARQPHGTAGLWLESLQMTSASTGWALLWSGNPGRADAHLVPARTTDGARTWTAVVPPAARALLSTTGNVVLRALDGEHAWLAVTGKTAQTPPPDFFGVFGTTEVFGTGDGGRAWTRSAPLNLRARAKFLSFAGPEHGWLVLDEGAAMGDTDFVVLYRSSDAGLHWSHAADSTPSPQGVISGSGLPRYCGKAGLSFVTASVGWLSGSCWDRWRDAFWVSRDGGARWAPQALPVPALTCDTNYGCQVSAPQFSGRTGFVIINAPPQAPYFLVSHDLGMIWRRTPLPPGSGQAPSIQVFTSADGLLVPAGPSGTIGRVLYVTADAGQTWRAVPQGRHFTPGESFDFVSTRTGFAWIPGSDAIYRTSNAGRTWTALPPRLAATTVYPL